MKPNKNFVIRLSPSAYEMAKLVAIEHLYSEDFCKDFYIKTCINEDECQNQVGSVVRVFNKKKYGTQGIQLKFTVISLPHNLYHPGKWKAGRCFLKVNFSSLFVTTLN